MANVQYRIAEFPNNEWDTNTTSGPNVVPPEEWFNFSSNAMRELCNQQLVRSTDEYQTFSLEGIAVVILISFALIITSLTVESCDFRPQRRRHPDGARRHERLAYAADGQLQLLRVVLENTGYTNWHDKLEDIPFRVPKDDAIQKDIKPGLVEPESFQLRRMQRASEAAKTDCRSQYGYHGVQTMYGLAPWPDPTVRPSSAPGTRGLHSHEEDSAPLLRSC